jgi:poly(A) polymerase
MERLGIPPGPLVGQALAHLLELRLDRGPMSEEEADQALRSWAKDQGPDLSGRSGRSGRD